MSTVYFFQFMFDQIDQGYYKISELDDETLFINIFYFYCFVKYLSPYCKWGKKALTKLKRNIKKKWSKECLPDVGYFIKLVEKQSKEIDPSDYFFNSEGYLMKLMYLKPIMDIMSNNNNNKKNKNKNKKKKKTIFRKPIR